MRTVEHPTTIARLRSGVLEYRLEGDGPRTAVIFHGGHLRAGLPLGEDAFTALGLRVLVPSRPGYGRTPRSAGGGVPGFTDAVAELAAGLGIGAFDAAVGVSAGGRAAVTLAARHPDLVRRVILESAVSFLPWPDPLTRRVARVVFSPAVEPAGWATVRLLLRLAPGLGLRVMLGPLTTGPVAGVLAELPPERRGELIGLFSRMRSGSGFVADLRPVPDRTAGVGQPTLVIASPYDGSVPIEHARSLTRSIKNAELIVTEARSHLIWFAPDYALVKARIRDFLTDA